MLSAEVLDALSLLAAAGPELDESVRARWRAPVHDRAQADVEVALPDDLCAAADLLADALPALTRSGDDVPALGRIFGEPGGRVLVSWCSASTWRRDARLAPLLVLAAARPALRERI